MKHISIIGFGRFGRTLYRLLTDDFEITLYDPAGIKSDSIALHKNTTIATNLKDLYASDTIFYAVPISEFEPVIAAHKQYFESRHMLIDVLSVKLHPATIFKKYLAGGQTQALLTHPMFGPDSSRDGFEGLPIVIDKFMAKDTNYNFWKNYFTSKKLHVIGMTADKHDTLAANSQGLTHFIGRLLEEYKFDETTIDTVGARKLLEIKEQVCSDTWLLFNDLQHYNPQTKQMRLKLGEAYDIVYNKLIPSQVDPDRITIGIQGGKGSFNEEAISYYVERSGITDYNLKYLYTSENVLAALHVGEIDRGQFAIHNSIGGIVGESVEAMAKYKFTIVEEYAIKIAHALMIRSDANYGDITTIMTHPQVLAQCKSTLAQKYPQLKQTSGEGDLVDHATVAQHLAAGKLPKNVGVMGSKVLAELYDLKIVEDNLQDAQENYTSFLLVSR